jgi:hypothetical protein
MRKLVMIGAGVAGLSAAAFVAGAAWSQSAPKTCTDAYSACKSKHNLIKECEAEKQWCDKTGTFADPKTKATLSGLQKK